MNEITVKLTVDEVDFLLEILDHETTGIWPRDYQDTIEWHREYMEKCRKIMTLFYQAKVR